MNIYSRGSSVDSVSGLDMQVLLLASYDGAEIMHHHLQIGAYWTLRPESCWEAMEHLYVLSGRLQVLSQESPILQAGDSFSACPVTDHVVFFAETEVEFLYSTSRPVFHFYTDMIVKLQELAISVEQKDGYTADHCFRIMNLSMKIAQGLQLSGEELYDLQLGSFLHDIGKVQIPDSILKKPGALSPDEWRIMKLHPVYSADMIRATELSYLDGVAKIASQHHERFDGSGYPIGLKQNEIYIGAAIVGVVDSFDAMTSDRVYRKALSVDAAVVEIIKHRGTLYNPDVVDTFVKTVYHK